MLHIIDSHTIDEDGADDEDVEAFTNNVLAYGDTTRSGEGNAVKRWNYSGGYAVIAWDTGSHNIVTLYPNDND